MYELPGSLRLTSTFPFVGRSPELETLRALMPTAEGEGRPDGRDPAEKNLSVHWVIAPGFLIVVRTLCPFRLGSG